MAVQAFEDQIVPEPPVLGGEKEPEMADVMATTRSHRDKKSQRKLGYTYLQTHTHA